MIAFLGFLATIPAANWMIGHVGACIPDGPCVIQVGFGLTAPSGVLVIGLAFTLRDQVHRTLGWRWALAAVLIGSALSWLVAPAALVLASVVAFTVAELADMAVYTPLYRRRLSAAMLLSGLVGSVLDSALFLWIAFGSLDHLAGQVVGKLEMVLGALAVLWLQRAGRTLRT